MLFVRSFQNGRLAFSGISRLASRPQCLNACKHALKQYKLQPIRFASTTPQAAPSITKKPIYPTRLLVYHAGTGRTVFIGCLKVTTIFLFGFFSLIVAPAQLAAPTLPYWRFISTIATGILPLLFVSWTTAPFVTYVHLRLPQFARFSKEMLTRYLRTLPKSGELDITTITLIGRPRVQRLQFGDLKAVQPRILDVANFKTDKVDTTRPWWAGKGQKAYAVGTAKGKSREGWAWDVVAEAIRKGKLRGPPVAGEVVKTVPTASAKAAVAAKKGAPALKK